MDDAAAAAGKVDVKANDIASVQDSLTDTFRDSCELEGECAARVDEMVAKMEAQLEKTEA